jgi:hypothetical protein
MQRRINLTTIDQHLEERAERLRPEAQTAPPEEREKLLREARRNKTAARMQDWLSSPGLQPPN